MARTYIICVETYLKRKKNRYNNDAKRQSGLFWVKARLTTILRYIRQRMIIVYKNSNQM